MSGVATSTASFNELALTEIGPNGEGSQKSYLIADTQYYLTVPSLTSFGRKETGELLRPIK